MMAGMNMKSKWPLGVFLLVGVIIVCGLLANGAVRADSAPYCPGYQGYGVGSQDTIGSSYFNDDHHTPTDAYNAMTRDDQGKCAAQLVQYFNDNNKGGRQMTPQDMAQAISNCRVGNPSDAYSDANSNNQYTNCANAYYTCMQYAIQTDCRNSPNLLSALASDGTCQEGKSTTCDPIARSNFNNFQNQRSAVEKTYTDQCFKTQTGTLTQQNDAGNACVKAMQAAVGKCSISNDQATSDKTIYTPGSTYADGTQQLTNFENCMQQAMRSQANDNQALCRALNSNNIYVANPLPDTNSGAVNNTADKATQKGCYGDTHVNTPQQCAAISSQVQGGTVWKQPDPTGNPSLWSCEKVNPTNQQQQTPSQQCDAKYAIPTDKNDPTYVRQSTLNADCRAGAAGQDCSKMAGLPTTGKNTVTATDAQNACSDGANYAGVIDTSHKPTSNGRCSFDGQEIDTNIISCDQQKSGGGTIGEVLKIGVYALSALIGVLAVGGLAWGSIKYAQAGDNQGTVSEAKTIIRDVIIGIALYGLMIAIINFLLPGGLFK